MFLEAVILGIILGLVRKGKLSNLGITNIRGWFVIIIAFFIQILPVITISVEFIKPYEKYTYIFSMVLLLVVVIINLDKKGFSIMLTGLILNSIVVIMNGFKMPISFEGLRLAGMVDTIEAITTGNIINYMGLNMVTTWTKYLGKFIVIPKPYPLAKVISVGDIFMSLGIIFFIQGEMVKSYFAMKSRMIRMGYKTKL